MSFLDAIPKRLNKSCVIDNRDKDGLYVVYNSDTFILTVKRNTKTQRINTRERGWRKKAITHEQNGGLYTVSCWGPFCKDSTGQKKTCISESLCYGDSGTKNKVQLASDQCGNYNRKKFVCGGVQSDSGFCSDLNALKYNCESSGQARCSIM